MKLGAKAVGRVAAPFIKKAGHRTVAEASKGMLRRASEHGVDKKVAKDIYNKARNSYHSVSYNTIDKILDV